jgi:hypothetical protein
LVKALKPYSTTNCVAHRFNNVVKISFYQTAKKTRKNNKTVPSQILEIICSSDSESDTDDDDDKEYERSGGGDGAHEQEDKSGKGGEYSQQGKGGAKKDEHVRSNKDVGGAASSFKLNYSTIKLSDIPPAALNILKTIRLCKSLVRYVKKVRSKQRIEIVTFKERYRAFSSSVVYRRDKLKCSR